MSLTQSLDADARPATEEPSSAMNAALAKDAARPRLNSIDLLRGLVMVVMALDHTRDFFSVSGGNPRDVMDPALFLTRWITHYCAPLFIFLAGLSAYLYGTRVHSTGEVSRFLLTRGFWLMLLEFTIMRLGWTFSFDTNFFVAQVIWVISVSMVILAGLVYLPRAAIAAFALVLIAGHNLLDGIRAADFGSVGWIWNFLHQSGVLQIAPETKLLVLYPLIPWVGVMAAGYAMGPLFKLDEAARRRWLVGMGLALTIGFVVLRATNVYGDPAPWRVQDTTLVTILSFINAEKYPPSLLYIMMTLGPGLLLLAAFERARGRVADWVTTFGRVPLFYYAAHIFLIHALAVVLVLLMYEDISWMSAGPGRKPAGYGLSLPGVYMIWLLVVVMLYPFCRWLAALKQRRREWWWSYL